MASIQEILRLKRSIVSVSENNNKQLKNINVNNRRAFKEDDDMSGGDDFAGGADSFDDFAGTDDSSGDSEMDDFGGDMGSDDFGGGSFDDGGYGGDGENQEGKITLEMEKFLENLDEAERPLVEKLITNFASLYNDQKSIYDRLMTENLDTSEYAEEVHTIKLTYEKTLDVLRKYLTHDIQNATTLSRVETFTDFKLQFDRLNRSINIILEKLGS